MPRTSYALNISGETEAMPSSREGLKCASKHPVALFQALRQHARVAQHRHEVRVPGPPRDDVLMDVVSHACAGDLSEIDPDVVALRLVGRVECAQRKLGQPHELHGDLLVERL